jgi:type II secretory pathway pseudopilin PulG
MTQDVPAAPRPSRRLESLVLLSILVTVAGVTLPILGGNLAESRRVEAQADMQHIVDGLRDYSRDTRFYPTGHLGRTNITWLYGPGSLPANNLFGQEDEGASLDEVLLSDSMGGENWAGPYLGQIPSDPWGHAYVISVDGLVDVRKRAWVLSAGPNGEVETQPEAYEPVGDDLALPLN